MSGIGIELRVVCPKCKAEPYYRCVRPNGAQAASTHVARLDYASNRFRVSLHHCLTHGLTTEVHDVPDYGQISDDHEICTVLACAVSIGSWDTEHCDQPVTGPFYATLDDPRPT